MFHKPSEKFTYRQLYSDLKFVIYVNLSPKLDPKEKMTNFVVKRDVTALLKARGQDEPVKNPGN